MRNSLCPPFTKGGGGDFAGMRMMVKITRKHVILWTLSLFAVLSFPLSTYASGILLDYYKEGLSPKWSEKSFKGKTLYQVTRENRQWCIKATSHSTASALYYKIKYDTEEYPILTWRWSCQGKSETLGIPVGRDEIG